MKYCSLFLIAFLLTDCKKNVSGTAINCESLHTGLLNNDKALVQDALGNLLNMKYTSQNFNTLTDTIAKSCDITIESACFNCVLTLPPQSEIGLAFLDNRGDSTIRILTLEAETDSTFKLVGIAQ